MKKKAAPPKSIKKVLGKPLTALSVNGGVCLLERLDKRTGTKLYLSWSTDGLNFSTDAREVVIRVSAKKSEDLKLCDDFSVSSTPTGFVMTYLRRPKARKGAKLAKKDGNAIVVAKSLNLYEWHVKSEIPAGDSLRATVVYDKLLDKFALYQDGMFVKNQLTRTLVSWREKSSLVFTSRFGMFDADQFTIVGSLPTKDGLLVMYDSTVRRKKDTLLQIGAVLFDLKDPKRAIWRSEVPLWQGVVEAKEEEEVFTPIGFVYFQDTFMIYWRTEENGLLISTFPALFKSTDIYQYSILERFERNPVIEPREHHDWEIIGTFNPAVFEDESGIHLFYRAIGRDGVSRIGYAKSEDGLTFDRRSNHPVFETNPDPRNAKGPVGYHPAYYTSGGGWGGSEDPRVVRIEDRIYLSYLAFEGWYNARITVTSISLKDFRSGNWRWSKPVSLSPYGQMHKNWVLFPEKIHGKFAILHGLSPHVLVDYVDGFDGPIEIRSQAPQGGREGHWDHKMRGAGPPPLKTPLGWLVFYHAHDANEPHRYKLGAMILDKDDPTKILHRSAHSILSPDMWYENDGKPGVVYASGAIIRDGDLYIYYGGGDRVVCIAKTPLKKFLEFLVSGNADAYELNKVSTRLS
jgi:predicted GH43/DUF377 family glycosyl hydrolase